jgi:hypothetical protein
VISTAQSKILNTLNNPSFRRSSEDKVREKLTAVLTAVKEGEEKMCGREISGEKQQQEEEDMQKTLYTTCF